MQGIQGGVSAAVEKEVEKMPEAPRHRRFRCREALRGVQSAGDADAATAAVLAELADLVARGEPYPLAAVRFEWLCLLSGPGRQFGGRLISIRANYGGHWSQKAIVPPTVSVYFGSSAESLSTSQTFLDRDVKPSDWHKSFTSPTRTDSSSDTLRMRP